jgi:hypothetical protein
MPFIHHSAMNQFKIVMYDTFCFKCLLKFFSIDPHFKKLKSCTLHDKHTSLQYKLRQAIFVTTNQMFRCSIYRQKYRVPFKSRLGTKFIWNFSPVHASIAYWTVYTSILHPSLNSLHIYPTPFTEQSTHLSYTLHWTVYTPILHPSLNSLHIYPTTFTEQSTHLSYTLHWTVYTSILHPSLNSLHIYPKPFTEQFTYLSYTLHWTVFTSILHHSLNSLHIYATPFTEQSTHLSYTLSIFDMHLKQVYS